MQAAKLSASRGSLRSELRPATGGVERRPLELTSSGIDVRFYRRSRTSSSTNPQPAHVEFLVQCHWQGAHKDKSDGAPWWDPLPQSYSLRRRWGDVATFHQAVCVELTYDKEREFTRIKTPIPRLPQKPDLDKFITGVAARGDSRIVHRSGDEKIDELDLLHQTYLNGQLKPYFVEVSKILAELPVDLLLGSKAFEKFVTSGTSCKVKDLTAMGPAKEKFFGPRPLKLDTDDLLAAMKRNAAMKAMPHAAPPQQPRSPSKKRSPAPPPALKLVGPTEPHVPMGGMHIATSSNIEEGVADVSYSHLTPSLGATMKTPSSIGAMIPFAEETRRWPQEEKRKHRMAASHYAFFAQAFKDPRNLDKPSTRDLWKHMQAKERAELGRRSLWQRTAAEQPEWASRSVGRLPTLPPNPNDPFAPDLMLEQHLASMAKAQSSKAPMTSTRGSATIDTKVSVEAIIRDISEGLRVVMLNDAPSSVPRSMRMNQELEYRAPADQKDAIKIYKVYRTTLLWEPEGAGAGEGSEQGDPPGGDHSFQELRSDSGGEGSPTSSSRNQPLTDLSPISWNVFLQWAQHKEDFAWDFKYRSCCTALHRALKIYYDNFTSPLDKLQGVHLTQLFQWIWPDIAGAHVAQMLTWICLEELSNFRFATPRLIDRSQHKSLHNIFQTMDPDGNGHCFPEDVAGGRDRAVVARMGNVVDQFTVKKVCGDGEISKERFMEYMCEENCRGHEDADHVWLEDGRRLVKQHRKIVDVTTWVLTDVPEKEVPQRLLADAIENEIRRWRRRAQVEATARLDAFDWED